MDKETRKRAHAAIDAEWMLQTVRAKFMITHVEEGEEVTIPVGTIAESNGRLAVYAGVPFVCLWVPGGSGRMIAQNVSGCEPVNDRAREMLSVLKEKL